MVIDIRTLYADFLDTYPIALWSFRCIIRESIDSLCRDGVGPPIVCVHWKVVLSNARVLSLSGHLAILRFSTQWYPPSSLNASLDLLPGNGRADDFLLLLTRFFSSDFFRNW